MDAVRNLKHVTESVIFLFCLWHMTAVAAFVFPLEAGTPFSTAIVHAKDITKPYTLLLSQWQHWNIFAPDPLQLSSSYRIELMTEGDVWSTVHVIDYDRLQWHERAKEFKILENLEGNWQGLVPHYLQGFCTSYHIPDGNLIRLVAMSHILSTELDALKHSAAFEYPISERELGSVPCGS